MNRFLFFAMMSNLLYGLNKIAPTKPIIPVEMKIPVKHSQKLFRLLLSEYTVDSVPEDHLELHGNSRYFRVADCEKEYLYYPAHTITQAVKHFQKYLDRFYRERHPMLPIPEIKAK